MARRALISALLLGVVLVGGCMGPCLPPIASFMACPDGSRNDFDMQFSSTSQTSDGHGLVFFRWDFGDGTKTDDYYGWVTHRYVEPGTFTVSLTITDDRGVKATAEQLVVVSRVVELSNVSFTMGYPSRAEGEIANLSSLYLYSASIKVKFYDQDGVRVGETMIDVQSIDPGERVRFVAEAPDGVGPIASAVAFVQSFAAECSGGPVPPPVYTDK
ncbi:MAG: PKD domain-containing protein [Candidatus Bipolaricaulota bacterium]|nr:PKD domain-containing protein [Candidatus Bipolaricaulota bacterium]